MINLSKRFLYYDDLIEVNYSGINLLYFFLHFNLKYIIFIFNLRIYKKIYWEKNKKMMN
jgi:hypothetical protein